MQKDKARACENLGFVVNKAEKILKEQDKNLQVGVFAKKGASWTYDTPSVSFSLFQDFTVFKRRVLRQPVEYASSSQRDNYPSTRFSELEML